MRRARPWHVVAVVENIPFAADHRLRKQVDTLLEAGHEVSVVTMRDPAHAAYRSRPGLRLLEYRPPRQAVGPLGYLGEYGWSFLCAAVLVCGLRLRRRIDVLQLCQPPDVYIPLAWLVRWSGGRIVVDQRDLMPEILADRYPRAPGPLVAALHLLERLTQRVAHRTITVNGYLRDRLVEAGAPPDGVEVIVNGPVLARVDATQPDPRLSADPRRLVVWVGKMGVQDRVDLVVRVAAEVVRGRGRSDCRFVLIGDGECLDDLRRQVVDEGLTNCVGFTGWVPEEVVFAHLATADLGVDTSLQQEVTPVKALEYMAFGIAFAGFDLTETRRLAAGAALLVPPGDVDALASAVVALLDDAGTRQRLAAAGRAAVEQRLSWERQAARYLAVVGPG